MRRARSKSHLSCPIVLTIALVMAALSSAAWAGDELSKPMPVLFGKSQLDVELFGHAAPFVADIDDDGRQDLLVGESYQGRMRIYRNVGGKAEPKFADHTPFKDGDRTGCLWGRFGPQVVDFDGDGRQDVISGDWVGRVILFRRQADGTFAAGEPIKDREDKELRTDYGASAFACDWDGDGDLDLLIGIETADKCNVLLLRNTGTRAKYQYGAPEKVQAAGKDIIAVGGYAGPVAADWDGDGKLDLVLGAGDGSVVWFRNVGTRAEGKGSEPKLAAAKELVPPAKAGEERGRCAKVCVADWNSDGLLDLVVGDHGDAFDKVLLPEEQAWRDESRKYQDDLLRQWSAAFREYRRLLALAEPKTDADRAAREKQLSSAREMMKQLNTEREFFFRKEQALKPGKQYHGRVWVYLRKRDAA